jgi:flagellin
VIKVFVKNADKCGVILSWGHRPSKANGMIINHNLSAMFAERNLGINRDAINTEKIYSGIRINYAGDDSVGLAVSENMDQHKQVFIGTMTAAGLGVSAFDRYMSLEVLTPGDADRVIVPLDDVLKLVSKQRADMGAYKLRLEYTMKSIDIGSENLQYSEHRVRDTDMSGEICQLLDT